MKLAMTKTAPSVPPSAWLTVAIVYVAMSSIFNLWDFGHIDKALVVVWACIKYWREKKRLALNN